MFLETTVSDVIMGAIASQITGVSIVCSTLCSGADQRKYQSFASLTFLGGIHRWPVDSPHKGPVMRIFFPFNDAIMTYLAGSISWTFLQKQTSHYGILRHHATTSLVMGWSGCYGNIFRCIIFSSVLQNYQNIVYSSKINVYLTA